MTNKTTNNQTKQEKAAALLLELSSAYQEEAIENTAEALGEYETAQQFADDCCYEYRDILKAAGYNGGAIYKAFKNFGDECELQSVALAYYEIMR